MTASFRWSGEPAPTAVDLSTWEGRMAARARQRRALVEAAEIVDQHSGRLSPTPPSGVLACCIEWRADGWVGDDRTLPTYSWQLACAGPPVCDHTHHQDDEWQAATRHPSMRELRFGNDPQ